VFIVILVTNGVKDKKMKRVLSLTICLALSSCGPDPIERASEDPWSSKNQSVKTMSQADSPIPAPMLVDGSTVNASAISILQQATESSTPRLRANAIEALRYAPEDILEQAVRVGLGDENRGVRFVASMMIGEQHLCNISLFLEPLLLDDSKSVQAAAMFSIQKCGGSVDLNPIASMLNSDNPELRGNAAMILGLLGNTSAKQMIREALKDTPVSITPIRRRLINLQMAEALILLGDQDELEVIRAAIFSSSQESEVTAIACQIAGRLHDVEVTSTLESITLTPNRYPDEIRLIAATALAEINPNRMPMGPVLRFTSSASASLRSQCATALGVQGNQLSLGPLTLMMDDSDPLVQISAAGAVLRINNPDSMANAD
jgi:HEAT repeat protein